jgi:tetratricopeptide (TPR) repeat protein
MLDDPWGMVETLNALGSLFAQRSEFAPALEHFGRSLAIAREDGCTLGEANALNGSAGVYRAMGDPTASLEALHLCLPLFAQISEQSGYQKTDRANLARVFADMASCHLALEQPEEAIGFAEQARTIMEEVGDTFGVAFGYKMLGVACVQLAQIEEAIRYFHAALTTAESLGNGYLMADILSNLGDALMRNGQMELAMASFACALAENNGHGQRPVYIETLGRLGALYARADFDGRDEGAALRYLGKAQRIGEDVGALRELCPIYSILSNLHAELFERAGASGDSHHLQEALAYQRLLCETERRLLHEESDRKLRGLQLRYQIERAHREAEFLRCEAAIEQLHRAELAAAAGAPQ